MSLSIFPESKLHTQLKTRINALKRELERLSVRQIAVTRCINSATIQKSSETINHEENELTDELIAGIEAVEYDLNTFFAQMNDRQKHLAKGLALLAACSGDSFSELLIEHFIEEADLSIRDAKVALEGYDELIAELVTLTV